MGMDKSRIFVASSVNLKARLSFELNKHKNNGKDRISLAPPRPPQALGKKREGTDLQPRDHSPTYSKQAQLPPDMNPITCIIITRCEDRRLQFHQKTMQGRHYSKSDMYLTQTLTLQDSTKITYCNAPYERYRNQLTL